MLHWIRAGRYKTMGPSKVLLLVCACPKFLWTKSICLTIKTHQKIKKRKPWLPLLNSLQSLLLTLLLVWVVRWGGIASQRCTLCPLRIVRLPRDGRWVNILEALSSRRTQIYAWKWQKKTFIPKRKENASRRGHVNILKASSTWMSPNTNRGHNHLERPCSIYTSANVSRSIEMPLLALGRRSGWVRWKEAAWWCCCSTKPVCRLL
mmetsp:Transcript_737/g.1269  ORF Transcript_737/g.1269 Transcript_737/m.1269 type:complete len:206 (-) Transcript_737:593-1210(-)